MEDQFEKMNHESQKGSWKKKIPVISLIGLIIGALGGFLYYSFVGCRSGGCSITSNPWLSTAWGAAFGYLVFDLFSKMKKKKSG